MCWLCFLLFAALILYSLRWALKKFRKVTFDNKTILITGASSGIGEEYALYLSQFDNTKLILLSNEKDELLRVKLSCKNPNNVETYEIDLCSTSNTQEVCNQILGITINSKNGKT
jgi:short-subunit dehydrogenase